MLAYLALTIGAAAIVGRYGVFFFWIPLTIVGALFWIATVVSRPMSTR